MKRSLRKKLVLSVDKRLVAIDTFRIRPKESNVRHLQRNEIFVCLMTVTFAFNIGQSIFKSGHHSWFKKRCLRAFSLRVFLNRKWKRTSNSGEIKRK